MPRTGDGTIDASSTGARPAFWDAPFEALLLDAVPRGAATLIDVGCGDGAAARTLLPMRPQLRYLGLDPERARLELAAAALSGTPEAARVELRVAPAERLPVPDGIAEVVLMVLTLGELPDPAAALAEARRALVPGGRLVAIEADNPGARFYCDGPLPAVDAAFAQLLDAARATRPQLDLGPRLPALCERAGFAVAELRPHLGHATWREPARELAARLRALAATLTVEAPARAAFEAAMAPLEALPAGARAGWTSHTVPLFLTVAVRPSTLP